MLSRASSAPGDPGTLQFSGRSSEVGERARGREGEQAEGRERFQQQSSKKWGSKRIESLPFQVLVLSLASMHPASNSRPAPLCRHSRVDPSTAGMLTRTAATTYRGATP